MKTIGIVVAAFAALAMSFTTASAAPAAGAIAKPARDRGMAEAPAAVQAAKVGCTVSDAFWINTTTDPKTKAKTSFYEVACSEGMGYLLQQTDAGTQAFNCLAIQSQAAEATAKGEKNPVTCKLPGNADPKQGLAPMLTAAGRNCTVSNARPMGMTAAGEQYYEVACQGAPGYVIKTGVGGAKPDVMDCAQFLGTPQACTLTTKEQIVASVATLQKASGQPCATPSDARFVGSGSNGVYYEIACGSGNAGYIIQADANGAYKAAFECSKAQSIGGGCQLTNVEVSEVAEAATYTKLAKAGGYNCDVAKYRFIGVDEKSKSEVVELACKDRADGAIAMFPNGAGAKAQFFDCVASAAIGVTCNLSQPNTTYAKYTAGLASMGKTSCKVSNAKWLASTNSGQDLIETACSDGLPGFVMAINRAGGKVDELLTCGQARSAGAACSLPTNVASAGGAAPATSGGRR